MKIFVLPEKPDQAKKYAHALGDPKNVLKNVTTLLLVRILTVRENL